MSKLLDRALTYYEASCEIYLRHESEDRFIQTACSIMYESLQKILDRELIRNGMQDETDSDFQTKFYNVSDKYSDTEWFKVLDNHSSDIEMWSFDLIDKADPEGFSNFWAVSMAVAIWLNKLRESDA